MRNVASAPSLGPLKLNGSPAHARGKHMNKSLDRPMDRSLSKAAGAPLGASATKGAATSPWASPACRNGHAEPLSPSNLPGRACTVTGGDRQSRTHGQNAPGHAFTLSESHSFALCHGLSNGDSWKSPSMRFKPAASRGQIGAAAQTAEVFPRLAPPADHAASANGSAALLTRSARQQQRLAIAALKDFVSSLTALYSEVTRPKQRPHMRMHA
eukprot:1373145-Pleurochrysis_carterae.AAC.2